jgi:hypothetical protein
MLGKRPAKRLTTASAANTAKIKTDCPRTLPLFAASRDLLRGMFAVCAVVQNEFLE